MKSVAAAHSPPQKRPPKPATDGHRSLFRLGLFGDTRSGKTVYLASLQLAAEAKQLAGDVGLRPGDAASGRYLGSRVAYLMDGKWPPGTLDSSEVLLLLDRGAQTIAIKAADFKGGDFGQAFYEGEEAETRDFIRSLYGHCNAFVFLVDPGPLKVASLPSASKEDQDQRQRHIQSINVALEVLRNPLRPFHRPVAIAFTKTDQHPDVAQDPEGFARKHMAQAEDYLRRHAPRRRYFAVSAMGNIRLSEQGPSEPLQPKGILEPILWCAEQQRILRRNLKVLLLVCGLLLAGVSYGVIYHHNGRYIRSIQDRLGSSSYDELVELYASTRSLDGFGLLSITDPVGKVRLRQEIASSAEHWMKDREWQSREDPTTGHIKSISDWEKVFDQTKRFAADFSGTENANRIDVWILDEKNILAQQQAGALLNAASDGNEQRYEQLLVEYNRIATADSNVTVKKSELMLAQQLLHNELKLIKSIRSTNQGDREAIRGHCQTAEGIEKKRWPPPDCPEAHYLGLVRRAYDREPVYEIVIRLSSTSDRLVKNWTVKVGNDSQTGSNHQADPLGNNEYGFTVKIPIAALSLQKDTPITIAIENYSLWGRNHTGEWTGKLNELKSEVSFTAQGFWASSDRYKATINDADGGLSAIVKDNEDMRVDEDELFEKKRD